jgi:uncharacterized membrane protein
MLAFSPGVYDTLKFVHILAAITWVGTALFFQFHAIRLRRTSEPAKLSAFAKDVEFWGQRLLTPSTLVVLIMGVIMVIYSPALNFSDTWILLGLIGIGMTFLTGAFYLGPTFGKLSKMIGTRAPDDPEIQRGLQRTFAVARVDVLVILLIVADMAFKPGI